MTCLLIVAVLAWPAWLAHRTYRRFTDTDYVDTPPECDGIGCCGNQCKGGCNGTH